MDLDFSFALVSSLTPRRKAEKTSRPTTEVSNKTNSLKSKLNLPTKSQDFEIVSLQKREEKENLIPKEQLMSKDEFIKPVENKKNSTNIHRRQSNQKCDFSVNMENIAVRRNQTKGRKKLETSPLQPCDNVLEINSETVIDEPSLPSERLLPRVPDVINISSDIEENDLKTKSKNSKSKNVKGESPYFSGISDSSIRSSLEVVESSCSEAKGDSFDNFRNLRSLSAKRFNVKTQPARTSGQSETSLSTAYDSDSFRVTRRSGKTVIPETPDSDSKTADDSHSFQATHRSRGKVIPETPDCDQSLVESLSEKNKSSMLSSTPLEDKQNCILSPKKNAKRKSSEISGSPDGPIKRFSTESLYDDVRSKRRSSLLRIGKEESKEVQECNSYPGDRPNANDKEESEDIVENSSVLCDPPKKTIKTRSEAKQKKLRTSNASSVLDMFKLESSIKDYAPPCDSKDDIDRLKTGTDCLMNDKNQKNVVSNALKEENSKLTNLVTSELSKKKRIKEKQANNQKNFSQQAVDDSSKTDIQTTKAKHRSSSSPKMSTLVLPSEIIPKFEHINRWLKDTQEKTIRSVDIDSASNDVISKKDIVPIKNKYRVSLSPRIKKKKEKAKTSLEEEQKLFEELYGADYEKRLNNDVDDATSRTSCQDSVEFSENVLDKLYGTVWQTDKAGAQSEPPKGRKKKSLPDRKKHRTSIYEVFSSSSSEDRFEEFLETVQRGRAESTRRRPTAEFIDDSDGDGDGDSLVFYQNIVSSAVKDQVNSLRREVKSVENKHKINRRRLSFGSSQDDGCSEGGRSGKKPTKTKKSATEEKTRTKKTRSKKKNVNVDEKADDEIDVFSLVTPLRIKHKKTETDFSDKIRNLVGPEVPRSVGKSKTPKNPTRQKDLSNSEERLKTTYLRDCDFKVPKSASKTFKTPSKSAKPEIPSSPALSFLSSLSEMTAGLPCHPDALIYKKNFKTKREELTKRLFTLYNKEVFDNQLPADMMIQWNTRMTSTSGYCYNKRIYRGNQVLRSSRIVLSTKILDRADRLRDTLIHELCHAATWILHATSDGHGPIWRSWADRANRRFPELPVIKRCHDYAISTKFTYKCMSCGYSIGRHTKSLDTERKRCGYCFGKFQVFVTAKMGSESVTSGSDAQTEVRPRGPTGFALFVKQNYAEVKKANNAPHATVMKLLSQKFAEVKISKQNSEPIVIE